jgi:hypothetical protein
LIIILKNVRVTLEKSKDLFINIFLFGGRPILEKNKGVAFFEKELERERALNRKERRAGG